MAHYRYIHCISCLDICVPETVVRTRNDVNSIMFLCFEVGRLLYCTQAFVNECVYSEREDGT